MSKRSLVQYFVVGLMVALVGCSSEKKGDFKSFDRKDAAKAPAKHEDHHEHGPHEGELMTLSDAEFRAEVVMDETKGDLAIYILDKDAKAAKPVEATELVLSIKHGDKVEEFKLAAAKQEGDPEGQASLFKITSEELLEELHEHEDEGAALTLKVGEKTITGTVKHHHH